MANIIKLEQTCDGYPEQYWAMKGSNIIGYIRLRWGKLTCHYLPNGKFFDDETRVIYHKFDDEYKGEFESEEERNDWLNKCKETLLLKYNEDKCLKKKRK